MLKVDRIQYKRQSRNVKKDYVLKAKARTKDRHKNIINDIVKWIAAQESVRSTSRQCVC